MCEANETSALAVPTWSPTQRREQLWLFLLWGIVVSSCVQFTISFEHAPLGGALRWYHLFFFTTAILTANDALKIRWTPPWIFFAVAIACNIIAYMRFGFDLKQNFKAELLLVMPVYYFVGTALARRLPYEKVVATIRRFLLIYLVICLVQAAIWVNQYGLSLYGVDAVENTTFTIGGLNSQGQWLAILLACFLDGAFLLPSLAVLGLAMIYTSRATFVLWGIINAVNLARYVRREQLSTKRIAGLLVAVAGAATILIVIEQAASGASLFTRFSRMGQANDSSTARVMFMVGGFILLRANPFGYGIGNVMPRIYAIWSGFNFLKVVQNMENLYVQLLLEAGVVALGVYLWMMYRVITVYRAHRRYAQLFFICALYWITELMAGGGGNDPLFWLALGLFLTYCELDATETASPGITSPANPP